MSQRRLGTGVVIGAGIGGLLAARVLADHAEEVTVLERDGPPARDRPRRYAPQGHHLHVLLRAGVDVVEELFPGITADMLRDGIEAVDVVRDVAWFQYGVWRARFRSGILAYPEARPALEARIYDRVAAMPRVRLLHGEVAEGLRVERGRVTGVRTQGRGGGMSLLDADLVVDAGGRGSKIFSWLEAAGFERPEESKLHTNLRYATRILRRPARDPGWSLLMMTGTPPHIKRGGIIAPIDAERWIVTLAGYFDEVMPTDGEAFLQFARGFPDPAFAKAIESCAPLSEILPYEFPFQLRRHVERLRAFPGGLLVLGDAVSSFDPAFGQGMATVALEAKALGRALGRSRAFPVARRSLARDFFARVARIVDWPWSIVTTEMLRFPETRGDRSTTLPALHWYGAQVAALASDPDVALQLTRVVHLMDAPSSLLRPRVSLRVARRTAAGWLERVRRP